MSSVELAKPAARSVQAESSLEDGRESSGRSGSGSPLLDDEDAGCQPLVAAVWQPPTVRADSRQFTDKKPVDGGEGLLVHLNGTRFCLSIWILADHFLPGAGAFVDRANIAVNLFIIMSGFVTQWANDGKDLHEERAILQFYVRRLGRVVLPTYLSMFAAALLMVAVLDKSVGAWHMVRCLCFLEPWREPEDWCPNGQTWTIAALVPSWLLYPAWKQLVAGLEERGGAKGLVVAMVSLWVVSFGPSVAVFMAGGGWITQRQHAFLYLWPPSQLADFALGVATAALARRHFGAGLGVGARGVLADAALALVVAVAMAVPPSGQHRGWEPLFNHGAALALAAFLYGSSAAGGTGAMAWVLSLKPLARMGKYSFEIFLFQQPLYSLYEHVWLFWLKAYGIRRWHVAVVYMISLFCLSALYAELVEAPYVKWLKAVALRLSGGERGAN